MPNQFPRNNCFSAFSSAATEAQEAGLADARRIGTSEERTVLALEKIADQLALIQAGLRSIGNFTGGPIAGNEPGGRSGDEPDPEGWDDDLDFKAETAYDPAINRITEQHYAVGGYRYTDLQHAILQAKRARRAAESGTKALEV